MSGTYGTIKPANIDISNDVEIFYHYRPSLNSEDSDFSDFKKLDNDCLVKCQHDGSTISGLFNLKLPLDIFNKKGFYTVYIKPKEININIFNIGTLSSYPDIRGVVFSGDTLSTFKSSNALVGYRLEYLNDSGETKDFKIITSSNLATQESDLKYHFANDGSYIFCTVTPSLSTSFMPNNYPYIGSATETVKLVNTKFNPVMLEIELIEHDAETLSYMIEGNQLVDKDNAIITTFNNLGEIYHQSEYGAYKDNYGNPLYEFKKKKDVIDYTQSLDNLENE